MDNWLRINILVEGKVEQNFVKKVLAKYFENKNIVFYPRIVATNTGKGGVSSFEKIENDLKKWIKQEPNIWFTTFFDFYGFPKIKNCTLAENIDAYKKVEIMENCFFQQIKSNKFIPYLHLHEIENFFFCDKQILLNIFDRKQKKAEKLINELEKEFSKPFEEINPELINNRRDKSPSHRLGILGYKKMIHSNLLFEKLNIDLLLKKFVHFSQWIKKLEQTIKTI